MNTEISYEYASGDLLEKRNTYFYSGFHGDAFLAAWRGQRDAFLARPPEQTVVLESPPFVSPTEMLLDELHNALLTGEGGASRLSALDLLVQRFEVTKRVHAQYNVNWRPVDADDYRSLGPYVRLAEVLELAFAKVRRLQYFNALLKCLDTLTALHARLDDSQTERVKTLIRAERMHAQNLADEVLGSGQHDA